MPRDQKNENQHVNCLITYMFMGPDHEKNKNEIKQNTAQVPQRNEMLILYHTALGFISKNEEYNLK